MSDDTTYPELETDWTDTWNIFADAVEHNLSEIHLLDTEARAYIIVMNELMTQYGSYSMLGYFDPPDWFIEEYPRYSNTYRLIRYAAINGQSIHITIDEVEFQLRVIDEFIRQLLPIKMVLEPDSMMEFIMNNPGILKDEDE